MACPFFIRSCVLKTAPFKYIICNLSLSNLLRAVCHEIKKAYVKDKIEFSKRWNKSYGYVLNNDENINQILNNQAMSVANDLPNMMVTIKHWAHFNYSFNFNNIQTFSEDVKKSDVNYLRHYCKLNIFPRVSTLFIINSITVISGFVPILAFISVSPNPMLT